MGVLLAAVSGFASGVFLRSLTFSDWAPVFFIFLLTLLFSGAMLLTSRRAYLLATVFCFCGLLGVLRSAASEYVLPHSFGSSLNHRISYEGVVVGDPDERDTTERIPIRITSAPDTVTLLAVVKRGTEASVGDRVSVSGTLAQPEPFAGDNGRMFRYDKYLESHGIHLLLTFAYLRVESGAPWYSLSAALAHIKHSFLNGLNAVLPEPYSSLAGGIVIGGKSGLGPQLQNAFVKSGLVQIIVLSGYNVMVVAEWVMAALALMRVPRRLSAGAGALALLLFVGIAGASATAVRAALMALIALYARATGRSYAASRALLVAVLVMLLWNPLYLVFDPGFDLSVVATIGLIWLAPLLESLLSFLKNPFWKNAVATTLAAQIAVLPLLLYFTGNLSLVSLPANVLVMPLVPVAMALSTAAGIIGAIFSGLLPHLSIVLALPAYVLNALIIFIAEESAALPWAALSIPAFPFFVVLLPYTALIALASSKRFSTTLQLRLSKNAST